MTLLGYITEPNFGARLRLLLNGRCGLKAARIIYKSNAVPIGQKVDGIKQHVKARTKCRQIMRHMRCSQLQSITNNSTAQFYQKLPQSLLNVKQQQQRKNHMYTEPANFSSSLFLSVPFT
jgi:hypothetical protein